MLVCFGGLEYWALIVWGGKVAKDPESTVPIIVFLFWKAESGS
jgi:hypothetical protein